MKKLNTLLLLLVTISIYSQTKQEIKDYYMEVTSPVRFFNEDESDGIFGCDSTKQIKFQEDCRIKYLMFEDVDVRLVNHG